MITAPLYEVREKVEKELLSRRDLCIEQTRARWQHDFFVIIQYLPKRKGESKGIQINIAALEAIPTPTYDTTLFHYHYDTGNLDLLWSLPAQEYALNLYHNRDKIAPSDYSLLQQVLEYYDGTLFKKIAEWENSDGTIKREREHSTRELGTTISSVFG